jgi:hypothetical protein
LASREPVTLVIVASTGRDQRTARRPSVASTQLPLSSRAPLPDAWSRQEGQRVRPWQRGNPGGSPCATRRKNACAACSSRVSRSCRTWRGRVAYSGNAARIACSSASCGERETATWHRVQAVLRCSRAVVERMRQRQRPASTARSCVGVGRRGSWEILLEVLLEVLRTLAACLCSSSHAAARKRQVARTSGESAERLTAGVAPQRLAAG